MAYAAVHLICMPFQSAGLSSLSIALLGTILRQKGIQSTESYLHFEFAEIFGWDNYRTIADIGTSESLIGELVFAENYHGYIEDEETQQGLTKYFGSHEERSVRCASFRELCLAKIGAVGAQIVGFSTSCHQLFPSIWLAKHIKERWPDVRIVFGGSACSPPMGNELFAAYREVDYVVSGYGESPLLELALGRVGDRRKFIENRTPVDLDALPIPDYGSFLEQARRFSLGRKHIMLAFESSRGCWWGQKNHCTFCGLNQLEMAYNAKSSDRALEEIRALWSRYGFNLFATDSILSPAHLRAVLPRLASDESKPGLFYEIKPNLKSRDIELLEAAKVQWVQPGIESLNTRLLRLLRKGVTAIQNLALLKWCRESEIEVSWNLLCGIPGEQGTDYDEQVHLMSRIPHLCPPARVSPIRVDRYSPYFNQPRKYGWVGLTPLAPYKHMHPGFNESQLGNIAYHFDGVGDRLRVKDYIEELESCVRDWKRRYFEGEGLFWDPSFGLVRIRDKEATVVNRTDALAAVLEATHDILGVDKLLSLPGIDMEVIDQLVEQEILYREDNKVLNLSVRIDFNLSTSS